MTSRPPAHPLLAEEASLNADFRRVVQRAQRHLAASAGDAAALRAERLALIDDLVALRDRLNTARSAVSAVIHRSGTARNAMSAYRRAAGALRR